MNPYENANPYGPDFSGPALAAPTISAPGMPIQAPYSRPTRKTRKTVKGRATQKGKRAKSRAYQADVVEGDDDEGYDEEQDYDEEEEAEEELEDYFSQQPHEVFAIMLDPLRKELVEFLEKDSQYSWEYKNSLVKQQLRSKSLDMCREYEMGDDEIAGRKLTVASKQESDFNPYV